MNRRDKTENQKARPSLYEHIELPDNLRKGIAQYSEQYPPLIHSLTLKASPVSGSSPLRGTTFQQIFANNGKARVVCEPHFNTYVLFRGPDNIYYRKQIFDLEPKTSRLAATVN